MNKQKELKNLITNLNNKLIQTCFFQEMDLNGYFDPNFELYFKDFFYIPLLFLQYQRPYLLFDTNTDRYRIDLIKNLEESRNLETFLEIKYKLKRDKINTILINYSKFIIYYVINLIKKFEDWGKKSSDILYNLVKEYILENEDFENNEIKSIVTKRYIKFLMDIAIIPEFAKILTNDIVKKDVKAILRYDIANLEVESSFLINSNFSVSNSNDVPHKEESLIKLANKKEHGVIELSLNVSYMYQVDNVNSKAFISFVNKTFNAFKYQELSFNALLLYMPAPLKFQKETFYLKTFQTLISSEVLTKEIFFLSRFKDINKEENVKLNKKDKNNLFKIVKLLKPVSDFNISNKNYQFTSIALKFFKDAMNKDNVSERMSYCVQALEAIYNTDGNQIARSISQRLSIIFALLKEAKPRKFANINPIDIQTKIKKAYEVRSKYVHGATNSKKSEDLLDDVIYYTQISIIVSLAILALQKDKINKEKFNKDLDDCLISKSYYAQYKDVFKQIKKYL